MFVGLFPHYQQETSNMRFIYQTRDLSMFKLELNQLVFLSQRRKQFLRAQR